MAFYTYGQNNSGGSFDYDEDRGITHFVIVEASSAAEADARAEAIGLYWNGCDEGMDCDCCGDRWYQTYEDGDAVPEVYGKPLKEADIGHKGWMDEGREIAVHYVDGRIVWFGVQ